MKQHITKAQWDELSEEQKLNFINGVEDWRKHLGGIPMSFACVEGYGLSEIGLPNIGQMIEFLGDCWTEEVDVGDHGCDIIIPENENLCDALWKASKLKLIKP